MNNVKNVTMDEGLELISKDSDYILLDVRTSEEYANGHIPGAINIDVDILEDDLDLLKDKTIYVYCRSGRRSKIAADILEANGYTDIIEFGGIIDYHGKIEK